jgi:hypothetical protein
MTIIALIVQVIGVFAGIYCALAEDRDKGILPTWRTIRKGLGYGFGAVGMIVFIVFFGWFVSMQRPDGFDIGQLLVWGIPNMVIGGLLWPRHEHSRANRS